VPLIGCAGNVGTSGSATEATPAAIAEPTSFHAWAPRAYAGAPAAILVLWPGDDILARDPGLWTAQGFDVVMPQPVNMYRTVADQQAALSRLVASARALAAAPIWLVGTTPAIDAILATTPAPERSAISGVFVTSVSSSSGSCSESVFYSDPGNGTAPTIKVEKSADCAGMPPATSGHHPSALPSPPTVRPNAPRIIEASAGPKGLAPAAQVHSLAQLIKASPSS
jgi:hypothetical protein